MCKRVRIHAGRTLTSSKKSATVVAWSMPKFLEGSRSDHRMCFRGASMYHASTKYVPLPQKCQIGQGEQHRQQAQQTECRMCYAQDSQETVG
jgi:hypothetical protein